MQNFRNFILPSILGVLLVLNIFVWRETVVARSVPLLKVYYLNVGQGDATLIEAPNGNQVLIDGGNTDNKVLSELSSVLSPLDKDIDMVLATHPDADHVGGLPEVLNRYSIGLFLHSGNETKTTQAFKRLESESDKLGERKILAQRGMRVVLDREYGVFLDILYPDKDVSQVESNEASIVARLTYGKTHYIFSGDAPRSVELHLTRVDGKNLESNVLKIGHHGSHTSSVVQYVGFVKPEYAVISAGQNNRYGHPHKETLATLERFGIKVLRTDQNGRIEIDSDGNNVFVK